ncbi:MAG TPA: hypothetical protein DCQ31_05255 [Bacteroidales bacterium]|nr:hypothetical protein [Bacteroidales bacterium]
MSSKPIVQKSFEQLKGKITDYILVSVSVFAALSAILGFFRAGSYGNWQLYQWQLTAIAVFFGITFFRKRFSGAAKIYLVVAIIAVIYITGLLGFGFFAAAKLLITGVSLLVAFVLSYRKGLVTLAVFLFLYLLFGFLFSVGLLENSFDAQAYSQGFSAWLNDAVVIFLASFGVMYIGYYFSKALTENFKSLENKHIELADNENKYRTLFDSSNDAIILIRDNRYFDCNEITLTMFKCSRDYIMNREPHEFSPEFQPDGINSAEKAKEIFNLVSNGIPQIFDWQHIKENGELFDVSVSLNVIQLKQTTYVQAVLRDITASKEAARRIEESDERYKKLVESFPDIIMLSNLEGHIVYGNKHLETITGITPADYKVLNRKATVHPDDLPVVRAELVKLLSGSNTHSEMIENRFIDVWGKVHWFSGTISKVYLNGQLHLQTVSRDITERKKIEEELEKYKNSLEELIRERTYELEVTNEELLATNDELFAKNELIRVQNIDLQRTMEKLKKAQVQLIQAEKMASLGVLTAGVAHEINNPLNFIMGGYEGLLAHFTENGLTENSDIQFLLSTIKAGVDRATEIVCGLGRFSRSTENFSENCNIHTVLDDCLLVLNSSLKNRITVEKQYITNSVMVMGNIGKLNQLFINFIINASQAIEKEGIIILKTEVDNDFVTVEITDNGAGISAENLNRITEPFFTTKAPGSGTGIGLYICHSIITEHLGTMHFTSKIDKGTTVTVKLPKKHNA